MANTSEKVTIRVHNVEHGEYIELFLKEKNGDDLIVIRDFGSKPAQINKYLEESAKIILNSKDIHDAILSHCHDDHYKGFKKLLDIYERQRRKNEKLEKPIRNAYIPYLSIKDINDLGAKVIRAAVAFIYILPKKSSHRSNVKNWLKVAPLMRDISSNLFGVRQGSEFDNWQCEGKVHWPPISTNLNNNVPYEETKERAIEDIIKSIYQELENNDINRIEEATKIVFDIERNALNGERVFGNLDLLEAAFKSIKSPYVESENDQNVKHFDVYLKNYLLNRFYDNIDDHSIVFSIKNQSESALFLSDLNGEAMDIMMQNLSIRQYYFLKSSHHGTRIGCDFTNNIKAKMVVHSCGNSNNGAYYGPNPDYFNISNEVICTNWETNNSKWKFREKYTVYSSDEPFKDFSLPE